MEEGSSTQSNNSHGDQDESLSDQQKKSDSNSAKDESTRYECNICLETAKDAVVSMCGHLFCWPCLHQWFDTRPNRQVCPVCKASISKEKVIPLYGRGGKENDPRDKKIPPRPRGQRTEESSQGFPGGFHWGNGENGHGGVQFSLGIGVFPISFFASFFNSGVGDRRPDPRLASSGSRQHAEEQFLSNVFLYVGLAFVFWLMFF